MKKKIVPIAVAATIATGGLLMAMSNSKTKEEPTVDLRIGTITDLHANLMNYDYFTTEENNKIGLSKLSTVISDARKESTKGKNEKIDNFILVDNGDTIQGSALGDYYAQNPLSKGHPVYNALSKVGVDVASLGNHEFNYGLDYLNNVIKGTEKMSIINSNVYDTKGNHMFKPYEVIEEKVMDNDGKEQIVKIGVAGFVPPQILNWDRTKLEGKVVVKDIVDSANEMVDILKNKEKVDIVLAVAHSGYGDEEHSEYDENASYELTKVKGVDAVVAGHTHQAFPSTEEKINNLKNVDVKKGTINGVATTMSNYFGSHLGVIDLKLQQKDGRWSVIDSKSELRSVEDSENDKTVVSDVKEYHDKTIEYVSSPIGTIDKNLNSFFALVSDNESLDIVQKAQINYVKKGIEQGEIEELKQYKSLPLISIAAPFKAGSAADDYVDIPKGDITTKDVTNLYKYSNNLTVMKVTGKDLKEMLERTATIYNTIDPASSDEQELLNDNFVPFNFNVMDGLNYEFDVTKAPRYDMDGNLIDEHAERVTNVTFNGEKLKDGQEFLLVTNSYFSGGGSKFPATQEGKTTVYISSDENREIVAKYLKDHKNNIIDKNDNWKIKSVDHSKAKIVFSSSSKGKQTLTGNTPISAIETLDNGLTKYSYDLTK
ncbi:bifunctional 2',3'-cyclic-nucleotide 2'-phosphodiesterase/3'-nucleotidase [Bacillus sp. 1P06AnD]|uniref:bifunctional 2',3'-cyclic-nucleotide 2'-phosphodiesterase/3'-nucleotidase n=1 Tax=Bacillus sp. 1P06AnD TaxID=3132208 RepID=UPI0039A3E340